MIANVYKIHKMTKKAENSNISQPSLDIAEVSNRCIWTELYNMGYNENKIEQLFILMESLPIHYLSENAKTVRIMVAKGHIVAI